jgi:ubiquinone/menaquinone biosynthesis C-methylase UbiE
MSDYKRAAVQLWTADPCAANVVSLSPGSRAYFERLLEARHAYAPWMAHALDYSGTAGLDVLDIGCGQGIDVARYAMAGARAVGVDLTPRHVELTRAHLRDMGLAAEVVIGDAEALPFPDASFDRVSSNGVLHHTPDIHAALHEARRVLRPGGEARVIMYNRNSIHYWVHQVLWRGVLRGRLLAERSMAGVLSTGVEYTSIGARPLVRVYSQRQVRALMRAAGFVQVASCVRHFNAAWLSRYVGALRGRHVLDGIGRLAGWYVVGSGTRPL